MDKVSVALGILAWIMLPIIFAPLAIILGAISFKTTGGKFGVFLGISSLVVVGLAIW
jgi:hypothetical protein